jgi:hypothetical protein
MGYYEQIGVENARHRVKRASLPRWRRLDWLDLFAIVFSTAYWLLVGNVLWQGIQWIARALS